MIDDRKPDFILWQTGPHNGVAEPALLIKKYIGTFEISQGGDHELIVNYETIPELIRLLRKIQTNPYPSK